MRIGASQQIGGGMGGSQVIGVSVLQQIAGVGTSLLIGRVGTSQQIR